jgi:UDPglucose 6-dehydrogenase
LKIAVLGQWHLGTVTAGCLAAAGHDVTGFDPDPGIVSDLKTGQLPVMEPGLAELIGDQVKKGRLRFSDDAVEAVTGAEIVWVAFDTPVDENDHADVEHVVGQVTRVFPHLERSALVLVSSQLPVGTTRRLEQAYSATFGEGLVTFAASPENLRLGRALQDFTKPDRIVVGIRDDRDRPKLSALFAPFTQTIEWMLVESAEMTKHALNAFLATSVAFANEIAGICEDVGADARQVERGLKSDGRIGPGAYLSPGSAFAGGTLARDIGFLEEIGDRTSHNVRLLSAVRQSNDFQKTWTARTALRLCGSDLKGKRITVWGLTYKPGTDTLRRSASVELCTWLAEKGAEVHAHDPAVRDLPPALVGRFSLHASAAEALKNSHLLILATAWPQYCQVSAETIVAAMAEPVVIDPNRFAEQTITADRRIVYAAVGRGDLLP